MGALSSSTARDRGGRQFGDNVVRFHEKARDEDVYVAYAIVPPQIDRAAPAHMHPESYLYTGVVRETDSGIVSTERYYQSTTAEARERVKLRRLVWDLIGTEYGGRRLQYEMFYSAAQPVVNRRMFRAYDWVAAKAMVNRLLAEY
jgi:aromatic ring hydroxylase